MNDVNVLRLAAERLDEIAMPTGATELEDESAMLLSVHLNKIADHLSDVIDPVLSGVDIQLENLWAASAIASYVAGEEPKVASVQEARTNLLRAIGVVPNR
jgi:hypothetical protein